MDELMVKLHESADYIKSKIGEEKVEIAMVLGSGLGDLGDKIEDAIGHINKNSTKHSESIITENYQNAQKFLNEIDSSCVYVNASTRFTDGGQFGFGAEIGISTQKLHARGPMGLKELTTTKYVIYGDGQIRE